MDARPLRPAVRLPVYLLWRADRHLPAAATAFIDFVGETTLTGAGPAAIEGPPRT